MRLFPSGGYKKKSKNMNEKLTKEIITIMGKFGMSCKAAASIMGLSYNTFQHSKYGYTKKHKFLPKHVERLKEYIKLEASKL
jgi:transposase